MQFNASDVLGAVQDIAANAVEKASDMVQFAGDIVRGDVAGGTEGIINSSLGIAAYAIDKAKEVFTGQYATDRE
ncbi:hypothetical protein BMW24_007695 [Mycobacterium heckeshornense]|uniref:Uncharacterized protein n=1 Tax=Mycobacterium heckeshornense TaxID=110505 RepID=A0A2G8BD33_9MYCO|nr:hypothetical protein [Mycobacterium heckeshornense]KMV22993.1 hypothetical protein ACT16_08160 [Mycobacterium heckeshornense]MCV7036133.1 hypothetical protein [Mycobacterium heckeshornense]PIJ35667.1 hypothetical protein BMW24_007695 [Mycobacterium heckeshornense]BCO35809.1 hypothetical protein MHEC_22420 [Mycobacterium heckeshornense]BCQ08964.1 hypothetical protein JMUB5695_02403 [Mycobacterium heckeshornense]